jgi:hypothetical protein
LLTHDTYHLGARLDYGAIAMGLEVDDDQW